MIGKNGFYRVDLVGEIATHPIAPLATRPGALLLLAGCIPQRRRVYPATPPAAHSGAFN